MDIADPEVGPQASAAHKPAVDSERYVIHSTLGAGGMGIVYLAEDRKLHRQVAIKKLKDDVASHNARARIQQEARLLAQLNHPNIVALHDVLEEDGNIALVMEYIDGTTLRAWMREHSPSLQQKLSLLMQICQGLQQAHSLGIIHRDLKSDNILITTGASGKLTAKITDFGIAKSQQLDEKTLTAENQLAGTITAMSPEQILGKTLDARSDLFSLGTIAYELLCGSRPFDKHDAGALAMANRITNEPHIPPQQAWADIPEPLTILLDKLLAKDPAQRPQSAQLVYQGFELLHQQGLESDSEDFTATLTDLFTRQQVKQRRRWLRLATGIAAALVVGAGGYWGWQEITRLEPQYIAVMPVEINGEIRGEENAVALTRTMVRQALMNSVSQLKASALVSFEPKEGQDFEAQLQALRNKGVTDALFAKLECAQVRCEIELQLIAPMAGEIKQQSSFTFLTDKRQEAEYRISNSTKAVFSENYLTEKEKRVVMSDKDYDSYLDILSRLDQKDLKPKDLELLQLLIDRYPLNTNLYKAFTSVSAKLFVQTDQNAFIERGLAVIERGRAHKLNRQQLLEQELWLRTYTGDKDGFNKLLKQLDEDTSPSADLIARYARFFFMQGEYESGLHYAEQASALNPSADNLYLVALNNAVAGNYPQARSVLEKLLRAFPDHWSSYSTLGNIEMESGNLAAAETAITSIPEHLRGWRTRLNLGVCYFLQGFYSNAQKEFRSVLDQIPNDVSAKVLIAETYVMLGQQENAHQAFNDAIEITKSAEGLRERRYRALTLAHLGRTSDAISLTLELQQESPEDTDVKYFSAQVYALSNQWPSANYYLEQLIEQGMSAEWFNLPAFRQLCTQPHVSNQVKASLCK
ncbi:protein kinase domain-containing protein [Microbulbifer pacificus]|uniref:Protein kinase n=1 Tax=Microbulbifer pacificus TaxID=407164 RepID=A0AAU0MXN6_9GAMM|nr:protein kinase [Microbulbifer pacificus]WOX04573.1 protein kinase [Microbulbifer pacificus]